MLRTSAVLSLLVLTLAGCVPPRPTTSRQVEFVDYTRQGGLLGTDDHLTLFDDRSATLTRRGANSTFTLDTQTFDRLREQLTAADFDHLDAAYGPEHACCDQFEHTLRYRSRTVRTIDGVAPDRLGKVLAVLSEIIAARSR